MKSLWKQPKPSARYDLQSVLMFDEIYLCFGVCLVLTSNTLGGGHQFRDPNMPGVLPYHAEHSTLGRTKEATHDTPFKETAWIMQIEIFSIRINNIMVMMSTFFPFFHQADRATDSAFPTERNQ